jgi:hypothetical protein
MQPIPKSASLSDPLWSGRLHDLADRMVSLEGKPKLIQYFTGLSSKTISTRYRLLRGTDAPAGRMGQTLPQHFVKAHNRGGQRFILQAASWASVFLSLEEATADAFKEPVNRGWLLTSAMETYLDLTAPMRWREPDLPALTLNGAYELMNHLGYQDRRGNAALARACCSECHMMYLILRGGEPEDYDCPFCAIQHQKMQLVQNSMRIQEAHRQKLQLVAASA